MSWWHSSNYLMNKALKSSEFDCVIRCHCGRYTLMSNYEYGVYGDPFNPEGCFACIRKFKEANKKNNGFQKKENNNVS